MKVWLLKPKFKNTVNHFCCNKKMKSLSHLSGTSLFKKKFCIQVNDPRLNAVTNIYFFICIVAYGSNMLQMLTLIRTNGISSL